MLLEKANLVVTPGVGFGQSGEGYVRFALTVPNDRVVVALERLKKVL
jgi:LL-diaminopimelate aminotransferase